MKKTRWLKTIEDDELDVAMYVRSWREGDNVTVTCDLVFAMEQAVGVFNEQKAEIERLKRNQIPEIEYQKYCAYKIIEPQIKGCLDRERELKKRVDELPKEILTEIGKKPCEHAFLNRDCEWYKRICKKYGVEVE